MDKYTVDLDQVLNDFEYSELTDQHCYDQKAKQNCGPSYVHNTFKNTNVKHSINNVFHSLNEYLNSDISPTQALKAVILDDTANGEQNSQNEPPQTDESSTLSNAESEVMKPQTEPELVVINDIEKEEEEEEEKSEEEKEIVEETEILIEKEVEVEESDKVEEAVETVEENHVALKESITEEQKTDTDLVSVDPTVEEKEENEDKEEAVKTEDEVAKIGFDDDLDLDDSELHKYLDELEKEFQDEKAEEGCEKELNEENGTKADEDSENVSSSRPNNLPLPAQEDKTVIDLVGNPGSTPYNNVYVNKELEEKPNSDTECSTSVSPTFSDISTETNSSCTPSTDTVNDEKESENQKNDTPEVTNEQNNATEDSQQSQEPNLNTSSEANVEDAAAGDVSNPRQESTENTPYNQNWLGKQAPLWIPDSEATSCLHCETKFTVIKRRHHCRACGYVLCSKCCNLKLKLEYLEDVARVCTKCYEILSKDASHSSGSASGSESNSPKTQPNPNNPLEYCSTVPPHQQVSGSGANLPAVMVPVGVLKRKGSNKRSNKSVMFCDGIRPGSDLTNLDTDFGYVDKGKEWERGFPVMDANTKSLIPEGEGLPPVVVGTEPGVVYEEYGNGSDIVNYLKIETTRFALQANLTVQVRIIDMKCCINKKAWCFTTEGLINVGQDEIIILLELLDDEKSLPKDVFIHINNIYLDAVKGISIKELGLSLHNTSDFLGSKNHAGFVYIRPTFQCLQRVITTKEPYLIGILIHRWETPWAKLFPLRLVLRLGAEYRYYPSPIISNRYRDSVFVEVGHTIINLLADFRNFSYTLPQIRGLTIHMEDKNTTVTIPVNRYDQVMKSMNNSSDHILSFAGNFSTSADSHLVCIQDTQSTENAYSTHAINIHNKPRKVTGASFIVFNGALKSSSGLTAKSSIVEDGLMIQIPADHMVQIRESLRNMKDHSIQCGCINAPSDETVNIVWGEPDTSFNINVSSPIDNKSMEGIPSIRVHNGKDFVNGNRIIRWTEVFIIQNELEANRNQEPIDISKVSESIAKATCTALVKYLDLLASNESYKIGVRANFSSFYVAYTAGSNGTKLPPIYMESLDNEVIPVLHRSALNHCDENTIILELIFRILRK